MFSAKEAKEKTAIKAIKIEEGIFQRLKKDTEKAIKYAIRKGETSVRIKCDSLRALVLVSEWLNDLGFKTDEPNPFYYQYAMSIYWDEAE